MKTNHILKLYDALQKGEVVSREKFCRENQISARTFYRYIDDIRYFLKTEKGVCTLQKIGSDNCYRLKSDSENLQKPSHDSYDFGRPIVRSTSACMGEESRDAAVSL